MVTKLLCLCSRNKVLLGKLHVFSQYVAVTKNTYCFLSSPWSLGQYFYIISSTLKHELESQPYDDFHDSFHLYQAGGAGWLCWIRRAIPASISSGN